MARKQQRAAQQEQQPLSHTPATQAAIGLAVDLRTFLQADACC
jgi:hypothetical protein